MKNGIIIIVLVSLFLFCCTSISSSDTEDPFMPLTNYVESHNGWSFNHNRQSDIFNEIRVGLGDDFGKKLCSYVGSDLDRIYWCGLFLIEDDYLHGSQPDAGLAIEIFEKGAAVKTDPSSNDKAEMNMVAKQATLKIIYAILLYRDGQTDKARLYKIEIENLFEEYPIYCGAFPAINDEDRDIYNAL
ncbi:MAG: hypothetical protein JW881_19930 [Spirochaetales bacterium]|nr:hypothetical protein [Spirochaetales bacterium]